MKVLCTICARGGSKGLPRKNILPMAGKPLIAHSIEQAKKAHFIDRVIVSTDDEEIAEISLAYGAEVPFMRPEAFATDNATKLPALQHALKWVNMEGDFPDFVIDLQPTSPLRTQEDLRACYEMIQEDKVDAVFTGYKSHANPYFNMLEVDSLGYASLSKSGDFPTRQSSPPVYIMNGSIYAWTASFLMTCQKVVSGRIKVYEMPENRSTDIDTELDFQIAEYLLEGSGVDVRSEDIEALYS